MRHLDRDLWIMGEACKPYDLKCFEDEPGSMANPLRGDACPAYEGYQLWHKPCSCIPDEKEPRDYTCPSSKPTESCGMPVPPAAFNIANLANGLSNEQAVLNMQRHILEYGPIYVSYEVTAAFVSWDWARNPVYTGGFVSTGGTEYVGGHAVVAAGWGLEKELDYWLLRNSWGSFWADQGYFKFRLGVDLDGIESSESAVAMPTEDFADWSAPFCDITEQMTSKSVFGLLLLRYELRLTLVCDEDTSLEVWLSGRYHERGAYRKAAARSREPVVLDVELACHDFGLAWGEMRVLIKAVDSHSNTAIATHFLPIPAVDGVTEASGC
jgi:hypothetical protein